MFLDFFCFQIIFVQIEQYHLHANKVGFMPIKSAPRIATLRTVGVSKSIDGFPEIGRSKPFFIMRSLNLLIIIN